MRKRLRKTLSPTLSSGDLSKVYNSYDVVGSIAVIRLPTITPECALHVAKAIMTISKSVKTVLLQESPVGGDFRLRRLVHVAGDRNTSTIHKESGCLFSVDVEKCYFSPRLSFERSRVAMMVDPNETVVNMFAGVGCFSIMIAKHVGTSKVFSIDVNPAAFHFMEENVRLNRVYDRVIPLLGDSKEIISNRLQGVADRVLMPLPEKAFEYLPYAVSALKATGGWIHYYDFEHAAKTENPAEKTMRRLSKRLASMGVHFQIPFSRIVRTTGPNWYQVAIDIHVTRISDKS